MKLPVLLVMSCLLPWCAVAADCTFPRAPEAIPNGKTAAEPEMLAAMAAFKQYNADVTAYLACLETETTDKVRDAGGVTGAIMQVKSLQSKKHNAAVGELKKLASQFNEEVRIFKARR